jgi:lipopolysaccharide transport system ATP-binding protein
VDNINENREVAIQISGVKKMYKLGQINRGTLEEDLQSWWARVRGKEDPNSKIGQEERLVGQTFMALNGIDLTIYRGEALGIIGANGAGKSTLLKLLSRVTAPTEGEIDLYGRVSSMLEVQTGFSGEMTGRENIYVRGAILGMTKAEIDSKMEQIIDFSELRDFIDTPFKRYSSGMKVKLGFSVSAHLDSEIIIMDEVLAVGDMAFQTKCLGKMREAANKEGRTVLYVSHNMNTIRTLCDRCIVLDQGKVVFDGDVEEAIDVYMKSTGNVIQTKYDLSGISSKTDLTKIKAKIMSVELLGKDEALYRAGEHLLFQVKILAHGDLQKLQLRLELRFADGLAVGAVPEIYLGSLKAGETGLYRMGMETSLLTRGKYKVVMVSFEKDDSGNSIDYDLVHPAFFFEVEDDGSIVWNTRSWGHVKLPAIPPERVYS